MWPRGIERQRRRILLTAAAFAATVPTGSTAVASFTRTAPSASHTVSTGTLAAPTGLSAATGTCVILTSTQVNLSWTATSSTFADGYQILRSTTNGGPYTIIASVSGRSTTTFVDTTVAFSTTYYYVVKATRNLWRSTQSNQASVTTQTLVCV
jgi:hypothetical protein